MTTPNQCRFWNCDAIIRRDHFLCYDHYTGHQEGRINGCPQCDSFKGVSYPVCRNCERQPTAPQRGFARPSAGIAEPEARSYQPAAGLLGSANYTALLEELRDLRRTLARAYELQEFMVFSNDTLEQIATIRPATAEAMLAISGVGPVKMERFGWDFLRVINAYVSAPPARESRRPAAAATVERDNREFAADKDADRFFVYILMQNDGEYYIGITSELRERLHEHRFNMSYSTAAKEPKLQWFTTVRTRAEAADLEVKLKQMASHPASRREINRWVTDFQELTDLLDYTPYQSTAQTSIQEPRMPYGGVAPPSSRRGRRQLGNAHQGDMADVDDLPF